MISFTIDVGLGRLRRAEAWLQRVGRARDVVPAAAPSVVRGVGRRWTVVVPRKLTERRLGLEPAPEAVAVPPEGMFNLSQLTMLSMAASVLSGMYVYAEKHDAARLDAELGSVIQRTQDAKRESGVLRAQWTLANDPERLRALAAHYLTLQPTEPGQFARLEDVSARLPAAGAAVEEAGDAAGSDLRAAGAPQALAPVVVAAPAEPVRVMARVMPAPVAPPQAAPVAGAPAAGVPAAGAPAAGASAAPKLAAKIEPRKKVVELDPALVKTLLQGRGAPAAAPPRPHLSFAMAVHRSVSGGTVGHVGVERSEPPHELSLPPEMAQAQAAPVQHYAQAEMRRPAPIQTPRSGYWTQSAIGGQYSLPPPVPYAGYYGGYPTYR